MSYPSTFSFRPSIHPSIHQSIHPPFILSPNLSICPLPIYMYVTSVHDHLSCEATHEPALMAPALVHRLLGQHLFLLLPWGETWLPGMHISLTWSLSLVTHVQQCHTGDLSLRAQCSRNTPLSSGIFWLLLCPEATEHSLALHILLWSCSHLCHSWFAWPPFAFHIGILLLPG